MTIRYVLSDISEIIRQNIENKKFTSAQILFWILCYADYLKKQHISKIDSGAFIHQYLQIPVEIDTLTGRKYITLPSKIYDMNLDDGINYLSYDYTIDGCTPPFTSVTFSRTTPSKSARLYYTEEETPTPSNPYFYRLQEKVYLLGIECIDVLNIEGGLLSTFDPNTVCDLDADFDFPQELYPVLQKQILDLARFGLMIPNNRKIDGNYQLDNDLSSVPKKVLSNAQQIQQQQTQQTE